MSGRHSLSCAPHKGVQDKEKSPLRWRLPIDPNLSLIVMPNLTNAIQHHADPHHERGNLTNKTSRIWITHQKERRHIGKHQQTFSSAAHTLTVQNGHVQIYL